MATLNPLCLVFFISFFLYVQYGSDVLHLAAWGGHVEIVKYLIPKFGDRLFSVDNYGSTCLHRAVQGGHLAVVKYLIEECGFNPNLGNKVSCCMYVYILYILSAFSIVCT